MLLALWLQWRFLHPSRPLLSSEWVGAGNNWIFISGWTDFLKATRTTSYWQTQTRGYFHGFSRHQRTPFFTCVLPDVRYERLFSVLLIEHLSSRRAKSDPWVSFTATDLREGLNLTQACHSSTSLIINISQNSNSIGLDLKLIAFLCLPGELWLRFLV